VVVMMGLIMLLAGVLVTSLSFTSMDSSTSHMLAGIILLLLGKTSRFSQKFPNSHEYCVRTNSIIVKTTKYCKIIKETFEIVHFLQKFNPHKNGLFVAPM
jgi:hypothetical protein